MITANVPSLQTGDWKASLRDANVSARCLLAELRLTPRQAGLSEAAARAFRLRVPRAYLDRIQPGDPADPLLRQILPVAEEMRDTPGFARDAVDDLASAAPEGVLHKYHGRALLMTTGACAIHCRYCFRRHFPYADYNAGRGQWGPALARIAGDPSLEEIILSGGDPLALDDEKLSFLVNKLDTIPHVETLRIHTRLPVVLPERVAPDLLRWLGGTRLQTVVVIHANHANELDGRVGEALARIRETGAILLNQSVLLRAVNDDAGALEALSRQLFQLGVLPYYLHLPDPVSGTAHFHVDTERARRIMAELGARLPGYLVPRLAREESGRPSKTQLGWRP